MSNIALKVFWSNEPMPLNRKIDKAAITIEGQTSGKWHRLTSVKIADGTQPYVEYSTEGAAGKVVADAVIWKKVEVTPKNP